MMGVLCIAPRSKGTGKWVGRHKVSLAPVPAARRWGVGWILTRSGTITRCEAAFATIGPPAAGHMAGQNQRTETWFSQRHAMATGFPMQPRLACARPAPYRRAACELHAVQVLCHGRTYGKRIGASRMIQAGCRRALSRIRMIAWPVACRICGAWRDSRRSGRHHGRLGGIPEAARLRWSYGNQESQARRELAGHPHNALMVIQSGDAVACKFGHRLRFLVPAADVG